MGFLITLLIIFVAIRFLPRIAMWLAAWMLQRRARKVFGDAFGHRNKGDRRQAKNSAQSDQPVEKPKKIDANVGEYVQFEEIEVTVQTETTADSDGTETTTTGVTVEEQVVDVEWEDVE